MPRLKGYGSNTPTSNALASTPATATDMTAGSTAPLADAMESATAIVSGLCEGKTAIFPIEAALAVESLVGTGVATLEQQFTTLLND